MRDLQVSDQLFDKLKLIYVLLSSVTSELELIHHHYANSGVFKNGHEEYATTLLTQVCTVNVKLFDI